MKGEQRAALGDVLDARRARLFVGRSRQIAVFDRMVEGESALRVLYVHGPGGIGKTQLLRELARRAHGRFRVSWIDARAYAMDPAGVEQAVCRGNGPVAGDGERRLLVIDHFEHLVAMEAWFREDLLPSLPASTRVVFAGRTRLGIEWEIDPGWRSALAVLSLAPLSRAEAADYLDRCELPEAARDGVFAETLGHPLALALAAEVARQRPGHEFHLADEPDVIERLLSDFARDVPSELHGLALRAAALVLHVTEDNLARILGIDRAQSLYDWLGRLAFVDTTARGLVLHDLVRWVVLASLRWRAPELHAELFSRALSYFHQRTADERYFDDRENLRDTHFILSQAFGPLLERAFFDAFALRTARPEDFPEIEAMILRHEGEPALEWARFWRERPGIWVVVADQETDSPCRGFLHLVLLDELSAETTEADPATAELRRFLAGEGVIAVEGRIGLVRSWMACDSYQALSAVQTWIFHWIAEWLLTEKDVIYVAQAMHEVDFWRRFEHASSPQVLPGARFELGGRSYGYIGRDLRGIGARAWYRSHFADFLRMLAGGARAPSPASPAPPARAAARLERADLPALVKQALQALDRPEVLCESRLLALAAVRRRLAGDRPADRAVALAQTLRETAARFLESPRHAHYHRVLELAYLQPATKQEAAAAELGVGYSTFRRHLAEAVLRMAEILWLDESGA